MLDLDLLNDKLIGKSFLEDVIYFEQIDSTNAYAKRNDVGNNSLVVAEFQSAGRGRVDRQWESANAENLTFTIKKKFDLEPGKHQVINFYFSYFLLAAVESFMSKQTPADFRCEIKWPNDIILNGRKLAGMLIERYASGNFFVGVGLNVNQRSFNPGYPMEPISIATVLRAPLDRTN